MSYYDPSKIGVRESIAEMTVIELLQALTRNAFDCHKEVYSLLEALHEGKYEIVKVKHQHALKYKDSTEETKSKIIEYLVRTMPSLTYKDLFRSITYNVERTAQLMAGLAHRLAIIASNSIEIPKEFTESLLNFTKRFIEEFDQLREGIFMLNVNPKITVEKARNAMKTEEELDEQYRLFTFKLYEKSSGNIMAVLLLKEIIDIVEDSADLTKDAAEELMYLAMHKLS